MTDIYSKTKRSKIMASVKNVRTAPERQVAVMLKRLGVRYRRNVKSLPGQPDIVVPSAKSAILVNGCFWHGHANCTRAKLPQANRRFWQRKIGTNIKRDRRTARLLRKEGWHVITIWQCRLRNPGRVWNRLRRMTERPTEGRNG